MSIQAVIATCSATVEQSDGIVKALIKLDPGCLPNGEHIMTSLRRSTVDLAHGKRYRVMFEELPD